MCRCTLLIASLFNLAIRVPPIILDLPSLIAKGASPSRVLLAGDRRTSAHHRRAAVLSEEDRFQGRVFGRNHAVQVSHRAGTLRASNDDDFEVAISTFTLHSSTDYPGHRNRQNNMPSREIQQSQWQGLCKSAKLHPFVKARLHLVGDPTVSQLLRWRRSPG